jgi:hypothetical protein
MKHHICVAPDSHRPDFNRSTRSIAQTAKLLAAFAMLAPTLVLAQTSGGDAGSALWGAFRAVLYGPWGLVGSAVVVGIGIYMFLERGFMHALGVMAAGALLFFVPLIVISMRNAAQAMGGAG